MEKYFPNLFTISEFLISIKHAKKFGHTKELCTYSCVRHV